MRDSVNRFWDRVENYIKYRPGYPAAIIDLLNKECGMNPDWIVADIGSGTGILSELFLRNGNAVFGVEPNAAMREAGERLLDTFPRFTGINGKAEATTLPNGSVDLIVAGQAFHWFDRKLAREEFSRIIRPQGWALIIWNERRTDSTPFLRAYEQMLLEYGTDYQDVRHENVYQDVAAFFAPHKFKLATFDNFQRFDFTGMKGRLMSSSYVPSAGSEGFKAMMHEAREIFDRYQEAGEIIFEYDTKVYFGEVKN